MSTDSVTLPCPFCGKLTDITFDARSSRGQVSCTCAVCGTTFSIDDDALRAEGGQSAYEDAEERAKEEGTS